MQQNGISQEGLKLTACVSMLLDHIGVVLVYTWYYQQSKAQGMHMAGLWNLYMALRAVGRLAFPIYCFLLVEGFHRTHDRRDYGKRLLWSAFLSELPFDLAFSGKLVDMTANNVMLTLLLGLLMMAAMERVSGLGKVLAILPFFLLAELLQTDYAGHGILLLAMLALTRNHPKEKLLRIASLPLLLWFGGTFSIGGFRIPVEMVGILSFALIFRYNGIKRTHNKTIQWGFYLFYPVHLLLLWVCKVLLFG